MASLSKEEYEKVESIYKKFLHDAKCTDYSIEYNGKTYTTDIGYALEGVDIFLEVLKNAIEK